MTEHSHEHAETHLPRLASRSRSPSRSCSPRSSARSSPAPSRLWSTPGTCSPTQAAWARAVRCTPGRAGPLPHRRTWGCARAEVLSATAQAAVLLAVGLFVLVEGVRRLIHPPEIGSGALIVFGIIGLVGNVVSIAVLAGGRKANFNLRAAFLEVLNDALGSLAVIVAAIVIATHRLDPCRCCRRDPHRGADPAPRPQAARARRSPSCSSPRRQGLDLADVRRHLLELPHVQAVHDLHASQVSSSLAGAHRPRRRRGRLLPGRPCARSARLTPGLRCRALPGQLRALDLPARTSGTRNPRGRHPRLTASTGLLIVLSRRPCSTPCRPCVAEHFQVQLEHSTFQLEPAAHAGHEAVVRP